MQKWAGEDQEGLIYKYHIDRTALSLLAQSLVVLNSNTMSQPELYYVGETPYVPGSHLPIVVYRGAIAHCENEDAMKETLEANGGWKKGVS